jgi:tRNA pseudouridine55 synthase
MGAWMSLERLDGILNINKPAGISSRKVVDHVAKLVKPTKVGHAGTLDPLATGVLAVCVGAATRLTSFLQQKPKEYRAGFLLGKQSNTDDVTGEMIDVPVAEPVSREQIETLLPQFVGIIEQVPPQFSAVHVNGKRAYQLARKGETVQIKSRKVEVYRITLCEYHYPYLQLEIECGSGTYIRSLGRDLGKRLGCGAVMSDLVRTRIGAFRLEEAVDLVRINSESLSEYLLPIAKAVDHLPQFMCRTEDLEEIRCGRTIPCNEESSFAEDEFIAVLTPEQELACLALYHKSEQILAPKKVFLSRYEAPAS